jgi:hypothetical protein
VVGAVVAMGAVVTVGAVVAVGALAAVGAGYGGSSGPCSCSLSSRRVEPRRRVGVLECTPSRRHVTVSLSPWSKLLALDVFIVFSL